ncbi:hypothetical protein D8I35_06205 [Corticibacter populi]|uniref:VTT domain-containing protein n=1 Tax=Corticibacter populi TaxID=1550736 RepID=A0A3M6R130_9BURK|nr:VTT domain-containing protein [Corticibacter populi]RMX08925.1 hypothetical protein D8I35_06205 [Corticibacter populi]
MEWLTLPLDFILHVDRYLEVAVQQYGAWIYLLLFAVLFVETGLVVMPLLPGDSLLFVVGMLAGAGLLSLPLGMGALLAGAILGDQCNFQIGRFVGLRVFRREGSRFFNRRAFDLAQGYYERHGPITVVLARFMPFLRTFVPFVAGVARMHRPTFVAFNVIGALLWVVGISSLGYLLGHQAWVQQHLSTLIWTLVLAPGMLALWGLSRRQRHDEYDRGG